MASQPQLCFQFLNKTSTSQLAHIIYTLLLIAEDAVKLQMNRATISLYDNDRSISETITRIANEYNRTTTLIHYKWNLYRNVCLILHG